MAKFFNLLWPIFFSIRQIFIVANGKILTNILEIWSHWTRPRNFSKDFINSRSEYVPSSILKKMVCKFCQILRPARLRETAATVIKTIFGPQRRQPFLTYFFFKKKKLGQPRPLFHLFSVFTNKQHYNFYNSHFWYLCLVDYSKGNCVCKLMLHTLFKLLIGLWECYLQLCPQSTKNLFNAS